MYKRQGIGYELIPYTVDPDNLAADHVAEELGEDINRVFKTLVLHGEKSGHFVCVIPGNMEVDLKKAAKVAGAKKAEMIPMKDLLGVTGYIRGGCSPIGMKKQFPTVIDETAQLFDMVTFSGGRIGCHVTMAPDDLSRIVPLDFADITV